MAPRRSPTDRELWLYTVDNSIGAAIIPFICFLSMEMLQELTPPPPFLTLEQMLDQFEPDEFIPPHAAIPADFHPPTVFHEHLITDAIESLEQLMQSYAALRDDILHRRVLNPGKPIPKMSHLPLLFWHADYSPRDFRRLVRMAPATFEHILSLIENHQVFKNNSNNSQAPVRDQLAVTLYRLGRYGNVTLGDIAEWAGTVDNCTKRVMVALIDQHNRAFRWPSADEIEAAKRWVVSRVGCERWRNGYLGTDGTLSDLFEKPAWFGDAFFGKNGAPSTNTQLVTFLPTGRFLDYAAGNVGSVHDSEAFCMTRMYREHDRLLGPGEWIWADSAYPSETWCVTPFKKPTNGALTADQKTFNRNLSSIRLRIQISSKKWHEWAIAWIRCCLILHNLIIDFEGVNNDEDWRKEMLREGNPPAYRVREHEFFEEYPDAGDTDYSDGKQFREELMHALLASQSSESP
ncbi:hypothetical protein A0H81_09532 [Grifola frondosa]|uniref:DDE Tnp4 domain-containing protein n=1 Tax=Grifola frondosa TaxID=5627 RepID=A0A1C7M3V0_GRIFR|nr:hypothetical protein A0H81_09532 [Grifola frondosa]